MPTVGHRLLREAIDRIGVEQVARRLNLSQANIQGMLKEPRKINDNILLRLIDLIDESAAPKQ